MLIIILILYRYIDGEREQIDNITCYFFDTIINIKNVSPKYIWVEEKSYKNILIYHIGYVLLNSVKPLKIWINWRKWWK